MEIVGFALAIVNTICFIFAVFQMFSNRGIAIGCLGLVFPLGAYLWGWFNLERNFMFGWTVAIAIGIVAPYVFYA